MEFAAVIAILIRGVVGLWGYSGAGKPPMFGDCEAQRHWLEVTISLPIGDWYRHTSANNLFYWGLDYPPLTAYVSYVYGKLAQVLVPKLVEFETSRGHESVSGKVYMRATVLLADILLLIPVILSMSKHIAADLSKLGRSSTPRSEYCATLSALLLPALVLIDHGHFQYNGVCLALALLGVLNISLDSDIVGSIAFCLSLNFKQMTLYYAPVFFCCLLRKCLVEPTLSAKLVRFVRLGVTVVATFGVLWAPFCIWHSEEDTCVSSLSQVLSRQFPFSRGIFEDKVANIWYSLSVVVDFRTFMSPSQLLASSLSLTLALLFPTCLHLLTRPASIVTLLFAMINSSLAFFLASFQVHEKSLLLMLAPASLLVVMDPWFFGWMQVLGVFTMFPLLIKDQLRLPYVACIVMYLAVVNLLDPLPVRLGAPDPLKLLSEVGTPASRSVSQYLALVRDLVASDSVKKLLIGLSCVGMLVLHLLELLMPPPTRLPDLYAALFSIYGALNLCAIYVVCVCWHWSLPSTAAVTGSKAAKLKAN